MTYYLLGDNVFNKVFNFLKKLILSVLIIYAYNRLAIPLGIFIPLNIFTIFYVFLCGIPSILMLVLFSLICI